MNAKLIDVYYHDVEKEAVRNLVLAEGKRLDGRATTEIRPIWCEVDYLYSPHGSAVFTRGETQSLTTVTLGSATDVNRLDGVTYIKDMKISIYITTSLLFLQEKLE